MPVTSMGICLIENGRINGHRPTVMHDALRKRIAAEIQRQGREMKEVSLSAGLGETYVRDFLKRGRGKLENLIKVAEVLGHEPGWLNSSTTIEKTAASRIIPRIITTPARLIEPIESQDLPVYAAAMGGAGNMLVDFDPVETIERPAMLRSVPRAYGLLVTGESMSPAYDQGDIALVHPGLPPARDTDVILYDHPPDGQAEAIIKRLLSWSATEWHLRQINPPRDWSEHRADWPTCHRVIGKYARR